MRGIGIAVPALWLSLWAGIGRALITPVVGLCPGLTLSFVRLRPEAAGERKRIGETIHQVMAAVREPSVHAANYPDEGPATYR